MQIIIVIVAIIPFVIVSRYFLKRTLSTVVEDFGIDALSLVLGLGQISLLMFAAGVLQFFTSLAAWGIVGIYYFLSIMLYGRCLPQKLFRRIGCSIKEWKQCSVLNKVLVLFVLVLVLFNILGAYIPQVGEDAFFYHYALLKLFIQHGGLFYFPYNLYSINPSNIEMSFAFGMLVHGEVAANFINVIYGIASAWMIYVMVRTYLGHSQGLFWSVIFYSIPMVMREMQQAFIELGLCAFAMAGFYILLMAIRKREWNVKIVMVAGMFFGLAAGSKLFGAISGVLAATALLFVLIKEAKKAIFYPVVLVLVMFVVASPWYVRSVVHTGNPVYPALYSVFGGKYWNEDMDKRAKKDYFDSSDISAAPMGHSFHGLIAAPVYMYYPKFAVNLFGVQKEGRSISSARPDLSYLAAIFLPLGFVLFLKREGRKEFAFIFIVSSLFFATWYFFLPQLPRHLLPILGFIYLFSGFGLHYILTDVKNPLLRWISIAACGMWLITSLGFYAVYFAPKAYGAFNAEKFRKDYNHYYSSIKWVNEHLSKNDKLAIVSEMGTYLFDVPYIHLGPSFCLSDYKSKDSLYAYLKERGVTHLFVVLDESGNYSFADVKTNTIIALFRLDDINMNTEEEKSVVISLMELIKDKSKTRIIYRGNEKLIISKTPLSYGESVMPTVYELI